MNNYNAKYGIYAGIAGIIVVLGLNMVSAKTMITFSSWLGIIAFIVAMVYAVREERLRNKNMISFGMAFKHAWVTYLIYGLITSVFTYVFYNFIDPTLKKELMDMTIEGLSKMEGLMGEEAYEKMVEELEKTDSFSLAKLLQGLFIQLIFPGAFVSAIIALIMKKEPNPWEKNVIDTSNDQIV
jgi:hypothetical protein